MDDIEAKIAAETAAQMERHSLREAARRVSEVRSELGLVSRLPDLPDDLAREARRLHDNGVENLLWKIEKALNPSIK